jgi:starvation-inducible DNA-binding protein
MVDFTVPGMTKKDADAVTSTLEARLASLIDLSLTLKHVHWNVVGKGFIAVHEMLDTQVKPVRAMVDETAERIATLGGVPRGTPGAVMETRTWDDYSLDKALVPDHLKQLEAVYSGIIADHRKAQESVSDLDPVTEDMLIGQLAQLELFQWFVRAHLEDASGNLET